MRRIFQLACLFPAILLAQKPFINNISPTHIEVGQTVTISGSNLNNVDLVYFGGVSVVPASSTANTVTAVVPAGVTHGSLTVQTSDNHTVSSGQQFFISFSGSDITSYDSEFLVSTGLTDVYDICMCDLDNNGLNDLAIAHNAGSGVEVTIYQNNTAGTGALSGGDFTLAQSLNAPNNNTGAIALTCGDLDHDGDQDLVYTSNGVTSPRDIFLYRNNGSGFPSPFPANPSAEFKLPAATSGNRLPGNVRIADLDNDGNPDIIVGNGSDRTFHIYLGNGDFTFGSANPISITGPINTSSLNVADFNNDGRLDVVSLPFRESNQGITVMKNTSQPGSVSFVQQTGITSNAQRINVETADFDEDGLIDIVATNQQLARVEVYRNTSTVNGDITFAAGINVTITGAGPSGVDVGDMNGDGQPDLIIGSTTTIDDLFVIENTSTGSISFATPTAIPTTNTNQNVVAGDLNGDARPDIAFVHNIASGQPGSLGIFLNRNCVEPEISPNNLEFCLNDQFTLFATKTAGATYDWQITGGTGTVDNNNGDNADITITAGTTATVEVTITHDTGQPYECALAGNATFTLVGGTQPASPTFDAGASDNICVGDNYSISISGADSFDEFEWTKPDGSTEVIVPGSPTTTSSLDITNASLSDAGLYTVRARKNGECYSEESATFNLEVNQPPLLEIVNDNLDNFCAGTSITLRVPDFTGDFTYQWQRNGSDLGGQNGATLSANQTGNYTVEVTDANTCLSETAVYSVNEVALPTSAADGPSETCVGFLTTFTSSSTGAGGFTLQYEWIVNDGSTDIHTATTQDLDFSFPSSGAYTVTLNTSYPDTEVYAGGGGALCEDTDVVNVTVSDAPTITFDVTDGTEKCPSDVITVSLTSPSRGTIDTYEWAVVDMATSDTVSESSTSSIDASTPQGIDGVWVISRVTTTIGCQVQDTVDILNFSNSNLAIDEGLEALTDGNDTTVNGVVYPLIEIANANFIELNASGGSDFSWETGNGASDNFNNPNGTTTTFFPSQPLTLVTLSGTDNNDCDETYTIAVFLDNFRPRKTFSPNGDGMNDCWEILNIGDLGTAAGCKVYVFDSRGRNISTKENFESGDNCVWDGNFNGSPVPEGVYYFVMKCQDSNMTKSGSILLAR
ncbi:MAG: FG-GAP-like repeat-containing protein [Ekhidna sp.]|uniref:FG-GAP-like repeat-containing protein n=1 Tax=Ekhidna sp. TaxID=2608089 RepID=UPI0032EC7A55